jgi:ketosteroid isomerase-like protein
VSQQNVDIVRTAFDSFTRGDIQAVLRHCDEEIVITQPAELPGAPPQQHGHSGVLEAFSIWPEQWDDYWIEILDITDAGDHVIVNTRQGGRGKQGGVAVEMPFTFVFTLRDQKFVEWRIFTREDQALQALGLAEQQESD